jgi:hypothetical protein
LLALVALLSTLTLSVASAATLSAVTGPSPLANCTFGTGPNATNYTNAEVEPWIAVNPKNSNNLIGGWQQDRWSDGGAHGLVAGYSTNGGKNWNEVALPFTKCVPGGLAYERASDPWVSIGPDGTAYTISISFNESNNDNAVGVATSSDGGKSWKNLQTLIADSGTYQYFSDKESVTADPVKVGTAYAVWDRLVSPTNNPRSAAHAFAYTGPTLFSKTTDGGKTWSASRVIVDTAQNNQTIGNQIVVDPRTGTLYNFFDYIVGTGSNSTSVHGYNVAFIKSTDGGNTWSPVQVINSLQSVGVTDPNTGEDIRTGDIIPEPAIDPATGNLYVVWQDSRFNGGNYDEVVISSSSNGGNTWSQPVQVNTPHGRAAFTPAISINSAGVVGVTYYDFRDLKSETATLPTNYWFTSSSDGGASFGGEQLLKGGFDMKTAPYASGYFTGDYQGLAPVGTTFQAFFVATNSGNTANPTDVFFATVTP